MSRIRTCLWMDNRGEDAARFYVALFPNSAIESLFAPDPAAPPLVVNFHLDGVPYQILNGGPTFKLSEAASISVLTADQAETDRLWQALTADGGRESQCGWCVDRFGLSWQICPAELSDLLAGPDRAGAKRAMDAMLAMRKLDIAALKAAYEG